MRESMPTCSGNRGICCSPVVPFAERAFASTTDPAPRRGAPAGWDGQRPHSRGARPLSIQPTRGSTIPARCPDTKPSSAAGTASHDAVSRHNSPLSIESAELRPYIRHNSSLIAMKPEPRPYSRRNSRLSIESREL